MPPPASNRLDLRVAIYEIVSGFVAALAVGVAGAFTSDKTAPGWLLFVLFFGGLALWIGAVVWLFFAHRRLAAGVSAGPSQWWSVNSAVWGRLGIATTVLLTVLTAVTFVLAIRPDPSFASAYDGQDPTAANCVDSAVTTPVGANGPALRDLAGRKVGHIELRASPKCGTIWAKVLLDPALAAALTGKLVMLVMFRPSDEVRVTYALRLNGHAEGWSNMIAAVDACVRAEAFFVDGARRGPTATTPCRYEYS